jgi:hypothetical protein
MSFIFTDYPDNAFAPNNLALIANFFDGRPDFHLSGSFKSFN